MSTPREARKYLRRLSDTGIPADEVLTDSPFRWDAIESLAPMTPREVGALFDVIAARTPRAAALQCGRDIPITALGAFGHAMTNCGTLGEVFRLYERYSAVAEHPFSGFLSYRAKHWTFELRPRFTMGREGHRFCAEASVAGFERICRELLNDTDIVEAVQMPFSRSEIGTLDAPYEFGSVSYGAPFLRFEGLISRLDAPLPGARPELLQRWEADCAEQLARMSRSATLATRVEMLMTASPQPPSASGVATELGISRRSLFRKLGSEGTSFQTILDDFRRFHAGRMLRAGISQKEIAWRLGFSDARSFGHRFKTWTGLSASHWLRVASQGGGGSMPAEDERDDG